MSLGQYVWAGSAVTLGLYHLNGNSNDSSWNARTWTDTSMTYTQAWGKYGTWAVFDGSASKITLPTWVMPWWTNSFTVVCWFKNNSDTSFCLVWWQNSGASGFTLDFNVQSANNIGFTLVGQASNNNVYTAWTSNNNRHNIICVADGSNGKILYFDWIAVATGAWTSNVLDPSRSVWLGYRDISPTDSFFNWSIGEVIFENVWRSAGNVQRYYTYAKWCFGL